MRAIHLFLTGIFIITCNFVSAQNIGKTENIIGKWYFEHQNSKDNILIYKKQQPNTIKFGNYLNFGNEGIITVGRSAQCGNDPNIFRNTGTWEINPKTAELNTSTEILKKGKSFKIIKITRSELWILPK